MATEYALEFDGTGTNATTAAMGVDSKGGTWDFDEVDFVTGTASVTSDASTSTVALVKSHATTISTRYYDVCFKVDALPAGSVMVLQTRLGGTNKAQVMLETDGALRIRDGVSQVDITAAGMVAADTWVRVKWGITGQTQELRIYTGATVGDLFGTAADDTLTGAYTGGAWDQIRLGLLTSGTGTIHIDRLIADDTTWPASGGSTNISPTANAGPDQPSVIGNTLVTLDGSGSSDSDGTIASYAWTQTAGPSVTLSDSTVVGPTFTAPSIGGSATFELRVTDNDGAQSTADTVTITWTDVAAGQEISEIYEVDASGVWQPCYLDIL